MNKPNKQKIILTVGLPASGKTYWANAQIEKDPDIVNINRDDLRIMLSGEGRYTKFRQWRERIVTQMQEIAVECAIEEGKSVIISDTNLNADVRARFAELASAMGASLEINDSFMDTPLGVCIERDKARIARGERGVTQRVITSMRKKYAELWKERGKVYLPDFKLPQAFIFDIDGTLAKMNGRGPFDYEKVSTDIPNHAVVNVARSLCEDGYHIIVLSGRDGSCYDETERWLIEHGVPYSHFHMRAPGDRRPDYEIKRELFDAYIRNRYNVVGVFDDRDQVVHLWRDMGLTCMQVDYGSF